MTARPGACPPRAVGQPFGFRDDLRYFEGGPQGLVDSLVRGEGGCKIGLEKDEVGARSKAVHVLAADTTLHAGEVILGSHAVQWCFLIFDAALAGSHLKITHAVYRDLASWM